MTSKGPRKTRYSDLSGGFKEARKPASFRRDLFLRAFKRLGEEGILTASEFTPDMISEMEAAENADPTLVQKLFKLWSLEGGSPERRRLLEEICADLSPIESAILKQTDWMLTDPVIDGPAEDVDHRRIKVEAIRRAFESLEQGNQLVIVPAGSGEEGSSECDSGTGEKGPEEK